LTDEDAFNVSYRFDRGEPRTSAKKAISARAHGEAAGDCIDCHQCVAVCPTGVDIRDGASLGCIQCGLCIDACDAVMEKLGRPTRLIAYDTDINIRARLQGQPETTRIVRPRTLLYSAIILAVGGLMLWGLTHRVVTGINVIHDRNPEFVVLSDGGVRNAYTVRIINKHPDARKFAVAVDLPGAALDIVGAETVDGRQVADVGPDQTRELRAIVSLDRSAGNTQPIRFTITDQTDGKTASALDNFRGPGDRPGEPPP
jgi:cytochrome c oxidase accessory protein FixG